ncbi:hypothetical protein GCM10017783_04990 [Deinococcus piscis]|uniref:Protein-glutamine gamma-glutamyltransferase-like C-terminal domain-containing protein n=1 Tax=Deinococcus piscis TaxID=394230 RepID=A0ABQ3JZ93_9DEIO|nr:DUF4129 domain-containing protein [Deinococcus piscis]GHF96128.1 hypothetical protein GCM10017783_04990 [Deinococcus piscis]
MHFDARWGTLAYAALPLILWPLLPAWAVALLAALYALAARWPRLQPWRLALGTLLLTALYLPAISGVLAAGGWLIDLVPLFSLLVLSGLALWLVERAAEQAEERDSRAWMFLLPLALLSPHPLALVSLGAALLLRRGADDVALQGRGQPWGHRAGGRQLALAALIVVGILLLSFALPSHSLLGQVQTALWQASTTENPSLPGIGGCEQANWTFVNGQWVSDNGCQLGGGGALQQEDGLKTASPLVAALGGPTGRWLALLGAALAAGLWWRSAPRRPRRVQSAAALDSEPDLADAGLFTAPQPLHRVRAAYAHTEAHLAVAGLVRQEAETPAEYLRRAAAIWPAQASALATLAAAYAPVRYGGGITEAQSDAAERSAALILAGSLPAAPVFSDHSTADRPRSERQGLT